MKNFFKNTFLSIVLLATVSSYAQLDLSSEVGINFGLSSFQTDFGERYDFPSENAMTFSFGAMYYLKFFGREYNWRSGSTFFSSHFMLRASFDYINKKNIRHEALLHLDKPYFTDMTADIKMYNLGAQLEFYFFDLEDYNLIFGDKKALNPYLSAGVHYSFFDPSVYMSGSLISSDPDNYNYHGGDLFEPWQYNTVFQDKGSTFGISAGAGLRYTIKEFDLLLDSRFQYFFSDKVDGFDPSEALNSNGDPAPWAGDQNNDTMVYVTVGVIYTFRQYY